MSDINIFTSGDNTEEMRCTLSTSNGQASASKFCLAQNSDSCFQTLAITLSRLPGVGAEEPQNPDSFLAEISERRCDVPEPMDSAGSIRTRSKKRATGVDEQ
ncbi:hypothetical protein [Nitrosovibrio sp. Nv4]|uniref:hypothetical protein n=1 Tax=Nitrosovibrio sp. Nv4 TaxID=1945880 RepID=UPI000BC59FBA|nr:hypothetical protein [Nitrosovibrio sp. Nv4]SOD40022.1 hypothetical protein SAMN06298226_0263 [Nitrosovibrio sp. Nv4]